MPREATVTPRGQVGKRSNVVDNCCRQLEGGRKVREDRGGENARKELAECRRLYNSLRQHPISNAYAGFAR
jgi:hypothetical protein